MPIIEYSCSKDKMMISQVSAFALSFLISTTTTSIPAITTIEPITSEDKQSFVSGVREYAKSRSIPDMQLTDAQILAQGEQVCTVSDSVGVEKAFNYAIDLAVKQKVELEVAGILGFEFTTAIIKLCPRHREALYQHLQKMTPVNELEKPLVPPPTTAK